MAKAWAKRSPLRLCRRRLERTSSPRSYWFLLTSYILPLKKRMTDNAVLTLDNTSFGDVHYFYGPPTERPRHHRFDKGSYVYLFEDAPNRRARIEVANQPGSDDQDAFDGCKQPIFCFIS
jgi:hypothetical protein